jgi:hypothetical protein
MTTVSSCVGDIQSDLESVRTQLRTTHLNAVRDILTDDVILGACRERGFEYRNRILGPVVTTMHFVASALWPKYSFQQAWEVFGSEQVSSGSLSKARARLPEPVVMDLERRIAKVAADMSAPWSCWREHRVLSLDGTGLSMEDNPELKSEFGVPNTGRGPGRYPLVRMTAATLWGTMSIVDYELGPYRSAENTLAMQMLPRLSRGDLVVADRRFAGVNYYVAYERHGVDYITRAHQRLKIDRLTVFERHSDDDFVAELPVGPAHRRKDPTLPHGILARFIRVRARIRGKDEEVWLVTSLLDHQKYPADETARLYLQRWRIETVFRQLKVACGADVLRSKKVSGIRKEIAARVMAVNLTRIIMIEAAKKHDRDPNRLSFSAALCEVVSTSLKMSTAPAWQLPALYQLMLDNIAKAVVPERPGRNEPRATTREKKDYPRLKGSRAEWRRKNAAA